MPFRNRNRVQCVKTAWCFDEPSWLVWPTTFRWFLWWNQKRMARFHTRCLAHEQANQTFEFWTDLVCWHHKSQSDIGPNPFKHNKNEKISNHSHVKHINNARYFWHAFKSKLELTSIHSQPPSYSSTLPQLLSLQTECGSALVASANIQTANEPGRTVHVRASPPFLRVGTAVHELSSPENHKNEWAWETIDRQVIQRRIDTVTKLENKVWQIHKSQTCSVASWSARAFSFWNFFSNSFAFSCAIISDDEASKSANEDDAADLPDEDDGGGCAFTGELPRDDGTPEDDADEDEDTRKAASWARSVLICSSAAFSLAAVSSALSDDDEDDEEEAGAILSGTEAEATATEVTDDSVLESARDSEGLAPWVMTRNKPKRISTKQTQIQGLSHESKLNSKVKQLHPTNTLTLPVHWFASSAPQYPHLSCSAPLGRVWARVPACWHSHASDEDLWVKMTHLRSQRDHHDENCLAAGPRCHHLRYSHQAQMMMITKTKWQRTKR